MLTWSSDDTDQGPQEQVLTVTSLHYRESMSQYILYDGIGVCGPGGQCGGSGSWEILVQEEEERALKQGYS